MSCSLSTISSRSYCLYSLAHISTSGRTTRSRKFANVLTVLISKTLEFARSCVPVPVPGALRRNPPCHNHGTAVTALLHACDALAYMRAHGRHAHAFHSVPQQLLPLRYRADAAGRLPLRVLRRKAAFADATNRGFTNLIVLGEKLKKPRTHSPAPRPLSIGSGAESGRNGVGPSGCCRRLDVAHSSAGRTDRKLQGMYWTDRVPAGPSVNVQRLRRAADGRHACCDAD